ncbi:MAG: metallopeptidase family protein [Candidatus Limnocylindrales bacterium]
MPKRRRGARSAASGQRRSPDRFERLVERALDGIPAPFRAALAEVAVVIEDDATDDQLEISGLDPGEALYGLYEGTPRTAWGADLVPFPNKISLFRFPLEEDFPNPDDLADEVRITVIHELAHHLGIDDDRLDELGLE